MAWRRQGGKYWLRGTSIVVPGKLWFRYLELENNDLGIEHNVLEDSCEDCEKYFSRRQNFNYHVTTCYMLQKKEMLKIREDFKAKSTYKVKTNFGTNYC